MLEFVKKLMSQATSKEVIGAGAVLACKESISRIGAKLTDIIIELLDIVFVKSRKSIVSFAKKLTEELKKLISANLDDYKVFAETKRPTAFWKAFFMSLLSVWAILVGPFIGAYAGAAAKDSIAVFCVWVLPTIALAIPEMVFIFRDKKLAS